MKLFHEENSTMSGLFSQINLLQWSVQGNNGLLAKTFEKFSKSPIRPAGSHFWQAPNLQCEPLPNKASWVITRLVNPCSSCSQYLFTIFLSFSGCVTMHSCSHAFVVNKFSRSWCLHLAIQIFYRTGQKFDVNFSVQIFELLGDQIFVRLAWFRVNGTPKRNWFHYSIQPDELTMNL